MIRIAALPPGMHPCKWSHCKDSYNDEASLWAHLLEHINKDESQDCKWKDCLRTFKHRYALTCITTKRGHITDHIVNHMSRRFLAFPCSGCHELFRNRQKLFRHKKNCIELLDLSSVVIPQSHEVQDEDPSLSTASVADTIFDWDPVKTPLNEILTDQLKGVEFKDFNC
jgi:hypothetical protein